MPVKLNPKVCCDDEKKNKKSTTDDHQSFARHNEFPFMAGLGIILDNGTIEWMVL